MPASVIDNLWIAVGVLVTGLAAAALAGWISAELAHRDQAPQPRPPGERPGDGPAA